MKKVLFGIDGGGTKSRLAVSDDKLKVLERSSGGATNYLKIGIEQSVRNLTSLVDVISEQYVTEEKYLVLGTAGAGRSSDVELLEAALNKSLGDFKKIKVVTDAEITLRGAFEDENGAILIAGTGSILFYKNGNKIERVGGCGRIFGDEGSGYSIGRKALNYLSKVFDGREAGSKFAADLMKNYGINTQNELIENVYKNNFDVAKTAEDVMHYADAGEAEAIKVLEEEAEELIKHIRAIINRENLTELSLVLSGSLLENKNSYQTIVKSKITELEQKVKILSPKNEPEIGALLIALELLTQEEN